MRLRIWPVFGILLALSPGDASQDPVLRLNVAEAIEADNGRSWHAAFDLVVSDDAVIVDIAINLVPVDGVSRRQVDARREAWRAAIREIWSGRFEAVKGSGARIPIRVDVRFKSREYHHRVRVRSSNVFNDQLHWGLRANPLSIAHEFGHMIGAYDEYSAGGTDPQHPMLGDEGSIMDSKPVAGVARARHLELIRKTLATHWDDPIVEILPRTQGD